MVMITSSELYHGLRNYEEIELWKFWTHMNTELSQVSMKKTTVGSNHLSYHVLGVSYIAVWSLVSIWCNFMPQLIEVENEEKHQESWC